MKKLLSLLVLVCLEKSLHAQYVYTIKADSVKITNSCDTAELIIENHTQAVPGFLFNKGRGRTEFRRALRLNDSALVFGEDTIVILGNVSATNGVHVANRQVQLGGYLTEPVTTISGKRDKQFVFDSLSMFTVNSDAKISRLGINIDPSNLGTAVFGAKANNSNNAFFRFYNTIGGTRFALDLVNDEARFDMNNANGIADIRLQPGSTSFFNGGKVGIGTTSPGAKLEVLTTSGNPAFRISDGTYQTDFIQNSYISTLHASSSFRLSWANSNDFFLEDGPMSSGKFRVSGIYGAFVNGFDGFSVAHNERFGFFTLGTSSHYHAIGAVFQDNYNSGLTFFVKHDSLESELVRFTSTGMVGVGTSTPVDKLHVSGSVRITDTLKMPNIIEKSDTSNCKPVAIDASGNVFKLSGWNVSQISRTAVNDAGYTATSSDYLIAFTVLSAPRTVTLPAASSATNRIMIIKDESGTAASNTITINVTAGGTIDGSSTKSINTNYGVVEFYSNGSQWFTK